MGFCPACGGSAPLTEVPAGSGRGAPPRAARVVPLNAVGPEDAVRRRTGIEEVDRVLGGGLVPGATLLVGGEPGVGKSTLLLQVAGALAAAGGTVLVASAEESAAQVALRAGRLGLAHPRVLLAAESDVDAIVAAADQIRPNLLVVDSIQTVAAAEAGGTPGGVAQVREAAARLVHFSKESGVPVVLVGHVTKDGSIAGPRLLEHAVDVVLYLEGDVERGLRVLRSLKNRYGATHQVGLFEMGDAGMQPVADPSGWLLAGFNGEVSGSVVFPCVDGRRPMLVEVQALVSPKVVASPRRSVRGLEAARVHQVLAVLERHAGFDLSEREVYVSVVGGLQIRDPGADLPVAIALVSSYLDRALGPIAAWGEVGLTGEVRAVAYGERRAAEAARLGVKAVVGPTGNGEDRIARALQRAGLPPAPPKGLRQARSGPQSGEA
jgi:DNA repair protein RadA/Sms